MQRTRNTRRVEIRIATIFLLLNLVLIALWGMACAHVSSSGGLRLDTRVEFRDVAGRRAFRITPDGEGLRVDGGDGELLCALRLRDGRIVVLDGDARATGAVVRAVDAMHPGRARFTLLSLPDEAPSLEVSVQPDGDFELVGSDGRTVGKLKKRSYGFKIVDAEGALRTKVRQQSGRTTLKDADGTTYLSTRDPVAPEVAAALALEDISFPDALALSVALAQWPAPSVE